VAHPLRIIGSLVGSSPRATAFYNSGKYLLARRIGAFRNGMLFPAHEYCSHSSFILQASFFFPGQIFRFPVFLATSSKKEVAVGFVLQVG